MQILNGFLLSHRLFFVHSNSLSHSVTGKQTVAASKAELLYKKVYKVEEEESLFINSSNQNNRLGTSGICFLHFRSQHCVLKSYFIHFPNHFSAEITKYGKRESIGTNLQQSTSSCFEFIHLFCSLC